MEVHIQHRFLGSLADSSPGNAFGIDRGANINLGVNYAVSDRLSAGVYRARFNQIVTLAGTVELYQPSSSMWKMSLVGGVQGENNFQDHYSPYFQLATSLEYDRFRLLFDPTVVLNSRKDEEIGVRPQPINPEENHTLSLGVGLDASLTHRISIFSEFVPRLSGFGGYGKTRPTISAGVKIHTSGHVFTVSASRSQAFTPAQYAVNGEEDFYLGFNIYRKIR